MNGQAKWRKENDPNFGKPAGIDNFDKRLGCDANVWANKPDVVLMSMGEPGLASIQLGNADDNILFADNTYRGASNAIQFGDKDTLASARYGMRGWLVIAYFDNGLVLQTTVIDKTQPTESDVSKYLKLAGQLLPKKWQDQIKDVSARAGVIDDIDPGFGIIPYIE